MATGYEVYEHALTGEWAGDSTSEYGGWAYDPCGQPADGASDWKAAGDGCGYGGYEFHALVSHKEISQEGYGGYGDVAEEGYGDVYHWADGAPVATDSADDWGAVCAGTASDVASRESPTASLEAQGGADQDGWYAYAEGHDEGQEWAEYGGYHTEEWPSARDESSGQWAVYDAAVDWTEGDNNAAATGWVGGEEGDGAEWSTAVGYEDAVGWQAGQEEYNGPSAGWGAAKETAEEWSQGEAYGPAAEWAEGALKGAGYEELPATGWVEAGGGEAVTENWGPKEDYEGAAAEGWTGEWGEVETNDAVGEWGPEAAAEAPIRIHRSSRHLAAPKTATEWVEHPNHEDIRWTECGSAGETAVAALWPAERRWETTKMPTVPLLTSAPPPGRRSPVGAVEGQVAVETVVAVDNLTEAFAAASLKDDALTFF